MALKFFILLSFLNYYLAYTYVINSVIPDGWYTIKNTGSGKYLQVSDDNSNVVIGSNAEKWKLVNVGDGYITLTSMHDDYMLNVADNGDISDGTNIQIYPSNDEDSQQFIIQETSLNDVYTIGTKKTNGSKVIDVEKERTSDGSNVIQWENGNRSNQTWTFEAVSASSDENIDSYLPDTSLPNDSPSPPDTLPPEIPTPPDTLPTDIPTPPETISTDISSPPKSIPSNLITPPKALPDGYSTPETSPDSMSPPETSPDSMSPPDTLPDSVSPPETLPDDISPPETLPDSVSPPETSPQQTLPDNPEPNTSPSVTSNFNYEANMEYRDAPNGYLDPCPQAGNIVKESYNGINGDNSLLVYTPYGYDETKQYNIFYLMHGGGENENTIFSDDVKLQNILDHMIMNGELEPLIVVTPTFNKCEARTFFKEFRESVIPFVEGKYSTYAKSTTPEDIAASRMHRAYGGFSMGSASTWAVLVNCLDICAYYMPLSGDNWEADGGFGKAQSIADAITKAGLQKNEFFIFAATGSEDIAYPNMNPQMDEMKKMDPFIYTSDFSKGNFYYLVAPGKTHWWGFVKHYIYDALPSFFHEA